MSKWYGYDEFQPSDGDKRIQYVAGFLFEGDNVALIRKLRPAWQTGKLKGIGGHIEHGETPTQAMTREFLEETGYRTTATQWWPFAILSGENHVVHFFASYGALKELKSTTDEEVIVIPISEVTAENAIPNLTWLIPMAREISSSSVYTYHIREE
jgi:8-oxo-dGTP pyrophosphatase MutT (NUDIX family)